MDRWRVHPSALPKRIKGVKLSPFVFGVALLIMFPFPAFQVAQAQQADEDPLAAYRDKKRVLLLFAPTEKDDLYQAQRRLWKGEEAGFKERQLVVVPLPADSKPDTSTKLGKRFGVDPHIFTVILLGKDGHNAYQSQAPVTAETLYHRIDAMPMRREEMRRQKERS